ncbi:MAG: CZB domain-containing protein [Gammaproteobacteria bacterium]|nr:CZB domain-containing protein [Gammaproteobacteria bacterium]
MNLGQEITNHLEWIDTIASLLGNEEITEQDLQLVTQHDQCSLGQWLNSEASSEFKNFSEYEKLIESHNAFHKLAGNLITALQQGNEHDALESQVQFVEMSQKVIRYLKILQENTSAH